MASIPMVTLLGKVDRRILKRILDATQIGKHELWFFADYANFPFAVGSIFDVALEGLDKKMLPSNRKIKLSAVVDQFGNSIHQVPEGFQSIVKLSFSTTVPYFIQHMPTIKEWVANEHSISLAKSEDVRLGDINNFEIPFVYKFFFDDLTVKMGTQRKISTAMLLENLKQQMDGAKDTEAEQLLKKLKTLGLIKETENEVLELAGG